MVEGFRRFVGIVGVGLIAMVMGVMLTGNVSQASDYTENDMQFSISGEEATLLHCFVEGDSVSVPDSVDGYRVTSIESNAFNNRDYREIRLPDSVEYIYAYAFSSCDNLKTFTMPSGVKSMGGSVFYDCAKLESVNMANCKLKEIPDSTFSRCISLKTVKLPSKLKEIGSSAFERCYKLTGIKLGNNITAIGSYAFANDYMLKSITVPSSVSRVDLSAFRNCKRLQSVTFKNKNTKLSEEVFAKCESLKKVKLPAGIKNIPRRLFYGTGLNSFSLPPNVSIIKAEAFAKCQKLTSVAMNGKVYAVGDRAFAGSGLKSIRLNDKMQYIGNGAFSGTGIKKISLPDKVTYIGNRVFADCEKLNTIRIPSSVRGINPGAFNNCFSLKSIVVASGNKYYSSRDGVLYNKGVTKLIQYPLNKTSSHFQVPSSVKSIRAHAFEQNAHLKSVSTGAKQIGTQAFGSMKKLNKVVLQNGVKSIGDQAFEYDANLSTLTLPDSIQSIGYRAFYENSIESVHIPSSLKKLGSKAFYGNQNLREFTGGKGNKFCVEDGVLFNGNKTKLIMYPSKKKGNEYTIPKTVKSLGGNAFRSVKYVKKIYMNKKISKLAYNCIYDCKNLNSVVFAGGTNLESGYHAISGCDKLAVIVAPNQMIFRDMAGIAGATLITL